MNTETYIIIDRQTHEVLSPIFTNVKDADDWGMHNIVYFYQEFAQITIFEKLPQAISN